MTSQAHIIIADSSPLYRQGFQLALAAAGMGQNVIGLGCITTLQQALLRNTSLRLLVVDATLEGLDSFTLLKTIAHDHNVPILLTSSGDDPAFVRRAMFNGVNGVISKNAPMEQLLEALQKVAKGGYWRPVEDPDSRAQNRETAYFTYALRRLSNQERNVLQWVRGGLRNKQIASEMSVTEHTIKSHMSSILRKLNIENRTRLVMAMQQVPNEAQQLRSA